MEEIHTHSLQQQQQQQQQNHQSEEDLYSHLSSTVSLKTQPSDCGVNVNQAEMAHEIENIVIQRIYSEQSDRSSSMEHSDGTARGSTSENVDEAEGGIDGQMQDTSGMSEEEKSRAKYLHKRKFVIAELIDTEKIYVTDLAMVVEGYMKMIKEKEVILPPTLEGKDMIVFGNIHQIYDWHKDTFQRELEKCIEEPQRLGSVFIQYEKRFYMYVKYCENKPKSEVIVADNMDFFEDMRQTLGHRLQLPDMLIKPVQRIMKYQLMLKDILKHTDHAGDDIKDLQRAIEVMCIIPKAANDMMNVGRLQGFVGKITAQGKLLLQDNLMVVEHTATTKVEKQMFQERRVFLFEQIIIFSEETDKKRSNLSNPGYLFKNSLKTNSMSLGDERGGDPRRFVLVDSTPLHNFRITCQAPNEDVCENWVSQIMSILDMQGDFLRALQSPIEYQNSLTKELSAPDIASLQITNPIRKTQSQPRSKLTKLPMATQLRKQESPAASSGSAGTIEGYDSTEFHSEKSKSNSKLGITGKTAVAVGSPKPKRNLFEGFKQTLRPGRGKGSDASSSRSKDKSAGCGSGSSLNSPTADEQPFSDLATGSTICSTSTSRSNSEEYSPIDRMGSWCRVIADYVAIKEDEISVSKGESIQVMSSSGQMLLVHRPANDQSPSAEGLVPAHVLQQKEGSCDSSKSWHVKLKRPSFRNEKDKKDKDAKTGSNAISSPKFTDSASKTCPSLLTRLCDVTSEAGGMALFSCRVIGKPRPTVHWSGPGQAPLLSEGNVLCDYSEDGIARLKISNVSAKQSGEYSCVAVNDAGNVSTAAILTVLPALDQNSLRSSGGQRRPNGTSAIPVALANGEVENCRTPDGSSATSPSLPVDSQGSFNWKTSYDTDYAKISEISRGRYSIVRRCVDTRTAAEVAAKCINKNLTTRSAVMTEVSIMRKLKHPSLIQPLHLYESHNAYVVILPILSHGRLFEYICTKMQFDECQAANFICLLLDVVHYLHNCRIAHLDIKPENLLVDLSGSSPLLKLIDLGDAHQIYDNQYIHLLMGSPEFAAPELVTRKPAGLFSDIWSVGVVTYVMLSGVSPFLDESLDETCGNIVKRDFCYPDEYFARISSEAKDFISLLLVSEPSSRPSAKACLEHVWITKSRSHRSGSPQPRPIPTTRLIDFIERRRHQNDVTPVKYVR